jgi:hypothetical protein
MSSGFWANQDGLPVQFGTLKAQPEIGGDYLVYGETREIETYVALVPFQLGTGGVTVPAVPTGAFVGTGTPIQAGIQSMTTMFPLQITAPVVTLTSGTLLLTNTQVFLEEVTVETLVGATGGTSINMGLVTTTSGTSAGFVQVTPNAGTQILSTFPIASMATAGQRATFNAAGSTAGFQWAAAAPTTTTGAGSWLGNVPLVTNAITPLPNQAFLSTYATGAFTNGLIKVRIRYTLYGNIGY